MSWDFWVPFLGGLTGALVGKAWQSWRWRRRRHPAVTVTRIDPTSEEAR